MIDLKIIQFRVYGIPAPKGSVRAAGNRVIPSGSPANHEALVSWGQRVREAATRAVANLVGPVATIPFMGVAIVLRAEWWMPRPMNHFVKKGPLAGQVRADAPRFPITKPDTSKLLRSFEDELTGIVWDDDARIADTRMRKVYANPGKEGASVRIAELAQR